MTKWAEEKLVPSCTKEVAANFIYENIITRFGCPLTLISDQGTHFINQTIETLLKKFLIDNHRTSAYHPQANGAIEYFNKTLTKGLTKIYSMVKDDWMTKSLQCCGPIEQHTKQKLTKPQRFIVWSRMIG